MVYVFGDPIEPHFSSSILYFKERSCWYVMFTKQIYKQSFGGEDITEHLNDHTKLMIRDYKINISNTKERKQSNKSKEILSVKC